MENNNELDNNMNSKNINNNYYNNQSKFRVVSDSYSKNNFNRYPNNSHKKSNNGFFKSVFVPFVSGIVGCSLVLGTCFGVPQIKEKLMGTSSSVQTSTPSSTSGTVSQVNLTNYSDTAVYAANKILPSIVGIEIEYTVTSSFFMFGGQSTSTATASGSGIIISEDGYILTNNHVVDTTSSNSSYSYYELSQATSVKVKLFGNDTSYDATIVGQDSKTDLAVLKIEATGLTAAEFADSSQVKIGEFAMAIGNPLGLGSSITCGVISAVDREVSSDGTTYKCIQTDAAINSGNSGGALVNAEGKVIGVNTLKLSGTGVEGIGFAIPINSTVDITKDLIEYNKVLRPYIGLTTIDLTEELAKANNLVVGVYVKSVDDFSAGEKAGIKAGDVIVKADGKEVKTNAELNKIRDTHKIGEEMTITVNRNGTEKELTVKLQEAP
jgi:serine protease Do